MIIPSRLSLDVGGSSHILKSFQTLLGDHITQVAKMLKIWSMVGDRVPRELAAQTDLVRRNSSNRRMMQRKRALIKKRK